MGACGEILLDEALPAPYPARALLRQLAPWIGARVVEGARIERVRSDGAVHVVMAQRDVIPPLRPQIALGDFHWRAVEALAVARNHAFDLSVKQQHVVLRRRIRIEKWKIGHLGHGKN